MGDVGFVFGQVDGEQVPGSGEGKEAAARAGGCAPVGEAEASAEARGQDEGVACPG